MTSMRYPTTTTRVHEPSTAELIHAGTEQVSRLIRDEMALARAEMATKRRRAGAGAGLLSAGGLIALYGVAVLAAAAVLGLAVVLPAWLAALIVGAALLMAAGFLALAGQTNLKAARGPMLEETTRSIRADLDEVKGRVRR
jgi:hypothetical protein